MKINDIPVIPVLLAAFLFFSLGAIWYGVLFTDIWMNSEAITPEMAEGGSQAWMIGGFILAIAQVKGIAYVLKWRGWPDLGGAITTVLLLWGCFALGLLGYDLIYVPRHDLAGFLVDMGYNLFGWLIAAVVLTFMR